MKIISRIRVLKKFYSSVSKFPQVVLGSRLFQSLLSNVSKHERSEIVVMQSVMETLKLLSHDQSHEAKTQRKIIGASLTSLEFGVPKIGLTRREEQDAMEIKKKLVSGESSVIMLPAKKPRQIFPPEVLQLAVEHWERTTIVDPGKQRRIGKRVKDDKETAPIRWQTTTNEEAYESFKTMHTADVRNIMVEHAKKYKEKYIN